MAGTSSGCTATSCCRQQSARPCSATYANSGTSSSASFGVLHAGKHTVYARIIDKDDGFTLYTAPLVVAKANLTIRANELTAVGLYVVGAPPLTATYIGLVNGDRPSAISNVVLTAQTFPVTVGSTPRYTIPPKTPSKFGPGSYQIAVSGGITSDYAITYVTGTLIVLK
jgi:hypothetical protein